MKELLFLQERRYRTLLCCIVGLNLLAALLEGGSYAFLLSALKKSSPLGIVYAALLQCMKALFCYGASTLNAKLYTGKMIDLQLKLEKKLLSLPYATFHSYTQGKIGETLRFPSLFSRLFFEHLQNILLSLLLILISISILALLSPLLTLLTLFLGGGGYLLQKRWIFRIKECAESHSQKLEELSDQCVQNGQAFKTIHFLQGKKQIEERVRSLLSTLKVSSEGLGKALASYTWVQETIWIVLVSITLIFAFFLIKEIPLLITFLAILYRMVAKVQTALHSFGTIQSYKGQVHSVKKLMEEKEEVWQGKESFSLHHQIEGKKLSFSYPGEKKRIFQGAEFQIKKGSFTAIVGESGCGKSTLLHLLGGLFPPTSGEILLDSTPLSQVDLLSLRSKVGVVTQELFLFRDTLLENIRFALPGKDEGAVVQACMEAGAHGFISELKEGYQTLVGERAHPLSAGEKQRISLARALLREAEILLLDEPTSHLDAKTEEEIVQHIATLKGRKTILMVTHRLSTLSFADRVLVLKEGKFFECKPEDLLHPNSLYAVH